MRRIILLLTFPLFAAIAGFVSPAAAQSSVAASSCSAYREANDPAQQALYLAYLQGFANATSPDPRYTQSEAALADDAKKVRDWCGKNGKSSYAEAVYAVLGSVAAHAAQQAASQAFPQPPPQPTYCKAGATVACAGCSISCNGGQQATCNQGWDSGIKDEQGNPGCAKPAWCFCKK